MGKQVQTGLPTAAALLDVRPACTGARGAIWRLVDGRRFAGLISWCTTSTACSNDHGFALALSYFIFLTLLNMDHFGKRATYGSFNALTTSEFSTDATPFSSAASASTRLTQRLHSAVQIDIISLTEQIDKIESAIKNLQKGVIDKVQCRTLLTNTLDLPVQSTIYRNPEIRPWQHGDSRSGSVPFTFTPKVGAQKQLLDLDVYHMWQQNPVNAIKSLLSDVSSVSYFNDESPNNSTNSGKRVTFLNAELDKHVTVLLNNRLWVTDITHIYTGQNPPPCEAQVPMEAVPTEFHDMFYYDNVSFKIHQATSIYRYDLDRTDWTSYDMGVVTLAKNYGGGLHISNWDTYYADYSITEIGLLDSLPASEKMPEHAANSYHTSIYIKFQSASGESVAGYFYSDPLEGLPSFGVTDSIKTLFDEVWALKTSVMDNNTLPEKINHSLGAIYFRGKERHSQEYDFFQTWPVDAFDAKRVEALWWCRGIPVIRLEKLVITNNLKLPQTLIKSTELGTEEGCSSVGDSVPSSLPIDLSTLIAYGEALEEASGGRESN